MTRPNYLVIEWPDGSRLLAEIPVEQDAIDALHDATHEMLARAMGLTRSPVLEKQAKLGHALTATDAALEEAAVLAIQALARHRWLTNAGSARRTGPVVAEEIDAPGTAETGRADDLHGDSAAHLRLFY